MEADMLQGRLLMVIGAMLPASDEVVFKLPEARNYSEI
jgi:hypothetical protein